MVGDVHGCELLAAIDGDPLGGSIVVSVLLALTVIGIMSWMNARSRRRVDELIEEQRRGNVQAQQHSERDQKAYAQHVALNDLTAEKIKLENQYLQLQVKIGNLEIEARERNEEYHRLMTQKTQLEVQSLKLHIREQTKRLDDYSGYDEE